MQKKTTREQAFVKRVRPKKGFSKIFQGKVTRYRSRISEFEDDTPSSTIVRILVGVLLIHLIVIGGVWLRGTLKKDEAETKVDIPVAQNTATLEQPQVVQQQQTTQAIAPVGDVVITDKNSMEEAIPVPTKNQQAVAGGEQIPTALPADTVSSNTVSQQKPAVSPNPRPVASTDTVEAGPARHTVATGDSWESVARDNSCSVDALKFLNPTAMMASGTTLVIPMKPGEREKVLQERQEEAIRNADVVYVMKRGDTLSKVARKYKVSVAALQKYNNITDPRKVKIGQELKIPKK